MCSSYQVGIQQQLPHGITADIAYVGNKATHLQVLADYNQAAPCIASGTGTCGSLQSRRPVSNFAGIEIAYGAGSANYNSHAVPAGEARLEGPLPAELVHLWPYLRHFVGPPGDVLMATIHA